MLQYSEMLDDPAMTRVNIVGFTLNLLYLLCYYIYSQEKVCSEITDISSGGCKSPKM